MIFYDIRSIFVLKTNIIFRNKGYLVLQERDISFDELSEWFICHLNDYVYIKRDNEFVGVIKCKDFENSLREQKTEIVITNNFKFVNRDVNNDRINVYRLFRDDPTLFRLPLIQEGEIVGEYYNSLSYKENTERYHIKNMIPELGAFHGDILRFFSERNVNQLAVITDEDDLYVKQRISNIHGIDINFYSSYQEYVEDIRTGIKVDAILDIKYPDEYRNYYIDNLSIAEKVYIIFDIMSDILVRKFCEYAQMNDLNIMAVYAVGKDDIAYFGRDDQGVMSKNKTINDVLADEEYLKKFYLENKECFEYATDKKNGRLGGRVVRFNGIYNSIMDVSSKYINVKNGVRNTIGNPDVYSKSIHFFGPCIVQGICVTDSFTIESYLQRLLNEHCSDGIRVLNYGSATHTPYGSFCNDFLHAMSMEFNKGDMIVIMDAFTEEALQVLKDNNVPILMDNSLFDGTSNFFLNNTYHCNHMANEIYAEFIFQYLTENKFLIPDVCTGAQEKVVDFFTNNNIDLSFRDDSFIYNREVIEYSKELKENAFVTTKGDKIGGICTQANPFTLGHRSLVEYASREMDYVYLFVAQDSLSDIQFLERLDIVKDSVRDLENVKVFSTGTYLSSYRMFPDYFTVSNKKNEFNITNVWAETRIWAEVYCKALGINYRILGEEPFDQYTNQLINHLKETLPLYGIETVIIPRALSSDKEVISASVVRRKMVEKNYDKLDAFITPYAIELLKRYYEYLSEG